MQLSDAAVAGLPRGVVMAAGALLGGYIVGSLPVALLLMRGARRDAEAHVVTPIGERRLRGSVEVLIAGGVRMAALVVVLELLKGAVVGLGARAYDSTAWFDATAIAGCVTGDAFPIVGRRGRRGIAPLVSGLIAALPGAWLAAVVIAVPAALLLGIRGAAYDAVVAVTVPGALLLGTGDPRTLAPAAVIVVAVVARSRIRRRSRARVAEDWRRLRDRGRPTVVDQPLGGHPGGVAGGDGSPTRQTTPPR